MDHDPARPRLHFAPQSGWVNDPLGLTFHDGRYHLFFQHVPGRTTWATEQSWGHAVSDDLLHWDERAVVLSPGEGDDGIWSGSVVVPERGDPTIFYTSAREPDTHLGHTRVARALDPSWTAWSKGGLVAEVPADLELLGVRDPFVLHDGGSWLMVLGAGLADGTATALTYRSDDLETWTYAGLLAGRHTSEADPWTGELWECPQLFPLGDRWVLVVAVWSRTGPGYEAYAVGDLVDGRFHAERWARLSYGPSLYAASAFVDARGDRGLIHWIRGVGDPGGRWAGAHSLPHEVRLAGDRLVVRPHAAVGQARRTSLAALRNAGTTLGGSADVTWMLDEPGAAAALTVGSAAAPLTLDVTRGRLVARLGEATWDMPVDGGDLRVVVDGPVVEVFTNGGVMAVVVPVPTGPSEIAATGDAGVEVHSLR